MMYQWLLYLHVVGAFGFMLAHGISAVVAFQLKKEREVERIQALLDASGSSWIAFAITFLVLVLAGIALAFMGRWWRSGWIWTSLGVFLSMSAAMSIFTRRHYHRLRKVAGLPYMEGSKNMPAEEPAPWPEIQAVLDMGRPWLLTFLGLGGWAAIVWLMMFKPF